MRKLRSIIVCTLVSLSSASLALAQPKSRDSSDTPRTTSPPADVETAEQLYSKLDYDKANATAARVVQKTGLSHDQLVRAYRVLAVTCAILGKEDEARDAFFRLLVSDPDYTVDTNLGPKVRAPFVEARGQFRALSSKPGVDVAANVRQSGGRLRVTTHDPTHVARKVEVGYRWTASGEYTVTNVAVGEATVEVAPAVEGRTRLDFYALALDERDNVVFEAGNAQLPKSAFAEAAAGRPTPPSDTHTANEGSRSIFTSPIFWVVTGAVVVGGTTAAFFALREEPPSKAILSPQIRCGSEVCR